MADYTPLPPPPPPAGPRWLIGIGAIALYILVGLVIVALLSRGVERDRAQVAATPTNDVLAERIQSQQMAATSTVTAEREAAVAHFREMAWPEVVRLYEKNQGDNPTNLYTDALMSLNQGDITGADVLETVDATSSFTTVCGMAMAWMHSEVGGYENSVLDVVAVALVDRWPAKDWQDCVDDLDWSAR